ncbi:putative RNA-directed DNA polymerase, eukaryota, reverse transcriptase zinc-binding domain protein [Tanacetum coccineum]|uniref:RNA-directed DNA polymerase, eukaryota, reverse transcriptase zinc-binding domain protein n=1 Tax=Tanacetum coccineum TaxID=301880 RepID=A0ABQ5J5I2_9ASTR
MQFRSLTRLSIYLTTTIFYLRNMNRLNGNVFDMVKVLREELKRVQNCLDKDPDCVHLREEEYVFCNAYKEAARDEEMVLRQKTKIQWLKDGDQNSAYFHNSLQGRMFRSRIEVVYDSEGHKYEGDYIASKFVDHFSKFLGTEDEVFPIEDPDSFGKEFFYSSKLLGEFNANLISLVPKLQTPSKITDYRPIACCNVVYKCISKVITNRLKEGLSSIVDSNQSVFIPGRQISDNIFLAQEFMHGYGRKGGAQRCAFKVDIEKAYDTVNWDFLKIAFYRDLGKKGLRQGDPMSPYLFTIVMEVLNLMIKRQIRLDSRFSNVPDDVKEDIHLAMPFREGELPVRNKSLSFAGKLQLVASVLSSLHVYWASMFMLSVSICDSIDKLFKNFIWGKSESSSGIASVSWKDVCRPKNQGGLGLKSLRVMNCALMVKHLWYIASRKESLWVKWLNVYKLKGECLWDMKVRDSFSWNLKQILKLRDSVRKFIGYKIGNGIDCFVWYDRWHSNGPLCRLISNHIISSCGFDLNAKVADLICENNWIWPIEWSELFSEVIDVPVPVLSSDSVDKALWFNKKNEEVQFSVKEAWKVLRIDGPEVMWHKHVWFSQCIPRHAFILWMALKGRLKTQDRISRWIGADNMVCPFCKSCKDSHSHLFFQCGFAQGVWDRLKLMCRLEDLSYVWAEIVSGISVRKANNTLLFRSVERPADKVFDIIVDTVRLRLLGLKIKRSHEVEKAAAIWKIPIKGVGEKSGYGVKYGVNDDVLYGAFIGLELWIRERRLLFSVPVLVITPCFGEVGWGGFGFHIWDGVIRECRVEKSNVPVLTHRICRVRWFFLSLRDSQSFLYIVYDLTWVISSVLLGSGGIRGVRLCSDKRRLSRLPLVDSGFVRISPWEGLFSNVSFNHGTSGLGVLGYWGCGFQNYDARLFNFGYVSSYSDFGLYFGAGIGFYYDSGSRLEWLKDFSSDLVRILGSLNVQVLKACCMTHKVYQRFSILKNYG